MHLHPPILAGSGGDNPPNNQYSEFSMNNDPIIIYVLFCLTIIATLRVYFRAGMTSSFSIRLAIFHMKYVVNKCNCKVLSRTSPLCFNFALDCFKCLQTCVFNFNCI